MYNLHQLGWYSFQQLALTVAKEIFGQTAVSFLASKDGGRDGGFSGTWKKNKHESFEGQFVLQCKFTAKLNYNLRPSDLNDELNKVEKLVKAGLCDVYILFTNAGISGVTEGKIVTLLKKIGVKNVGIYDNGWIVQIIKENKRLRMLVPRVYGLGDLSQILDERVYAQGKVLLESLKDDLAKVVMTTAYNKAAKAMDQHGFVLLIGGPATGKTTIASLLAIAALDQWKAPTMKLETADQVIQHWNPNEKGQFFWVDDAFGVTMYESELVHRWNHAMPKIRAMLGMGVRIVMTSRNYIYEPARKELKVDAFPLLEESKVVIDIHALSIEEKRQILYNHLKMGNQSTEFKKNVKPHLEHIPPLKEFLPETARRLGSKFFTKGLNISRWAIEEFVTKQKKFFIDVLGGLHSDNISGLALIYMKNGKLASPIQLDSNELSAVERLNSSKGGCVTSLEAMNGSLVQHATIDDEYYWKFKHPTIGDAFSEFIIRRPELIEIYLRGCTVEKLMEQVTCGNVDLENAVIVPKKFFEIVINKLAGFTITKEYKSEFSAKWGAKRMLLVFLGTRCSRDFLEMYIHRNSTILQSISNPGLYLDSVPEVGLANKLYRYSLLPEENRLEFVSKVSSYAVDGIDLYAFKSERIKEIFTEEEFNILRQNVLDELVPTLEDLREEKQSSFEKADDAYDHMRSITEVFEIIESEFSDVEDILDSVRIELKKIRDWVEENESKDEFPIRETLSDDNPISHIETERSIFDDIDE